MPIRAADLARILGDDAANVRDAPDGVHAVVRSGDGFFAIRLRGTPVAELFVQLRPLDGFELAIRTGSALRSLALGDTVFDQLFAVTTNDDALARAFVDEPARAALLASRYRYRTFDADGASEHFANRAWTYEIADDVLVATKGTEEHDPEAAGVAVRTACTLAARAQRWAAEPWAQLAREVAATARRELALGAPILTTTRHAVDATVTLARRRIGDHDRLHTTVAAERIGGGDTLSLVDGAVANGFRPHVPTGKKVHVEGVSQYIARASTAEIQARLDEPAKRLLLAARPRAIVVGETAIEAVLDGACEDRVRLDAALELVTRWAVDRGLESGPYR